MADLELARSRRHRTAFGPDPLEAEGGRDMSGSLLWSSLLYRSLADVEHTVACAGRVSRRWYDFRLEQVAGEVFDQMVATPELAGRIALQEQLFAAVADTVGGRAVETLRCLSVPGHPGPADGCRERRLVCRARVRATTHNDGPAAPTGQEGPRAMAAARIADVLGADLHEGSVVVDVKGAQHRIDGFKPYPGRFVGDGARVAYGEHWERTVADHEPFHCLPDET
jgi:hypothetical protein